MRPDLLDFETTSSIVLTIAATDNASVPRRVLGPFIIDLSNTNEPPRFVQVAEGLAVREDAASESVVGVIRAIDPDLGQSVRVEVTGGTGSGLMTVDPETGRVSLNTGVRLDYETQPELTLEVQLVDSFDPPLITTGTVTVTVLNVNERPVISLSRTDAVLPEVTFYSGNQVLATATLSDPEGAQLKLDVVGGTGVDLIDLTANNEIKLKPSAVLDYETRSTWNIVLRATELTGSTPLSSETTLNVRVVNENEPPIMPNQSFSVFETARAGTVIAQLSFRDQDAGQRVQLAITGGDTDLLRIDQTGAIRLLDNAVLSSVNRPQLNLEITATDPNNLSTVANVTISVLPVNRPPRPVQFIDPVEFPSNAPFTYKLPAGLFTDADGHQITLSLTGVGTPLPTWLKFNAATGELIGTPAPRDTGDYRLIIQATDNGAPPLTGVLPLSLKLLETALPWHNKSKPEDVDTDGDIDPLDALVVINLLNDTSLTNGQAFIIVPEDGGSRLSKPDVTQDNRVSSRDALVIINRLNSNTPSPEPGSRIGYFVPPLAAQSVDAIFGTDSEDDSEQSLEVLR